MNYYEHHLGDYMRDTAHLSMVEDCAYRRLLDAYYIRERPLPVDLLDCCKLARATSKVERDAVAYVLREFFKPADDGHHQARADAEIARFQDKQRKAKASADARWSHSERNANASPNAMRTHNERNADGMHRAPVPSPQSPVPSLQTPKAERARGTRLPPDWELPQEWGDWAAQERPDLLPLSTADRFRDYWHAKPGKDGIKLDWQATWRNWVRGERAAPGQANGSHFPARPDPSATVAENPKLDATKRYLAQQAESAAQATPPPAAVLALRTKRADAQ